MISYNDLYGVLRKEKYSEGLQQLPENFVAGYCEYLDDTKGISAKEGDLFSDSISKSKKQLENSVSIFKEIILRRKKKILNLVFIAAETGIMKRDYENMLSFEREIFEKLVKAFEEGDKELNKLLNGSSGKEKAKHRMVMFSQDVEQFVDMFGNTIGPFSSGELANLDSVVSEILVSGGKASFVDEE